MKKIILDLVLALLLVAPASFGQNDSQFVKANQAYAAGNFREAITGYEELVKSGNFSANLFYNLGNAQFRAGDFGRAILNYERALALEPRHPESDANLRVVRDEARALELQRSRLERGFGFATSTQFAIAAALAFWFSMFLAAAQFFARQKSARRTGLLLLSLSILALSILAIYSLENGTRGRDLAIVTEKNVTARLATAENASGVLALPVGSAIKILSQRGDWIYAALPNDARGWIPAKSTERVRL